MRSEPVLILHVTPEVAAARRLANYLSGSGLRLQHGESIADTLNSPALAEAGFILFELTEEMDVESLAPQIGDVCTRAPQARLMALLPECHQKFEDLLRHAGVQEYLPSKIPAHQLGRVLIRYCEVRRLEEQNQRYRLLQESRTSFEHLLGGSVPMRALYRLIEQVSRADAPVLIIGEPGSEFEEVASSIHERSDRRRGPIVTVDCDELEEEEQEKVIFGPAGGDTYPLGPSPNGSAFAKAGKGTLLIKQIEHATEAVQRRLINFFHHPYYQGETMATPQPIARIIAASSANLAQLVEEEAFNRELYYRLNILRARIPPLRERREDIPIIAEHVLQSLAGGTAEQKISASPSLSSDALMQLFQYPWPGNVKELEDAVLEAAGRTKSQQISKEHLPLALLKELEKEEGRGPTIVANVPMKTAKRQFEAEYFKDLLTRTRGNMTKASRISKVGRPYLYKKLKEHEIDPEEFR